ncbi:hypothetical protein [Sagittula marina]|nr:hypothetical protein [Sagittula marina]
MTELLKKHMVPKRLFSDGEFSEPLDSLRFVRSEKRISSFSRKDAIAIGGRDGRRHSAQTVFDPETHPQGTVDAIMYIGAKKRQMRYKVYDKIFDGMKDRTKKHEYLLPLEKSRSRLEVTLDGFSGDQSGLEALGVKSVYNISSFRWHGLRQILFNFVYPTFSMDGQGRVDEAELEVFKIFGAFGLDLYHRAERKKACDRKQRDSSGALLKPLEEKGRSTHFTKLNDRLTRKMMDLRKRFQN